ncbi:MAG: UDP-glucose/GDP-mannose dehydrogenase family protein [Bacteroidetes bacterium]|nr:UDP-glucose/GDP-mannose dehydrogenase family protein [Bacteroidota bacterium]
MKLSFIGTGYVGLVSATAFAEMGNDVICVDVDEAKVQKLRSGGITIYEPGLEILFERNIREHRLHFTTSLEEAVAGSDIIFLTLPTPPREDGSADLSYVMNVALKLSTLITSYKVIVTKSTVPVGTADRIRRAMEAQGLRPGTDFDVVSNPEFLREGAAVNDFMKPERVVVGTSSPRAADAMRALYEPFVRNGNPILIMDERSSELVKYASNGFLAVKISFINEIANLCSLVGADVDKVRIGMGKDSRIGSQFLYAGVGYGGSCFPKDVKALYSTSTEHGYDFSIMRSVMDVNERQRDVMLQRILEHFNGDVNGVRLAVWGLAFKANTDDVREAPALQVISELTKRGAVISAFDPEAIGTTKAVLGDSITYGANQYEILDGAEALLVFTEWNEFRNPDFTAMKERLNEQTVFDGRNLYDPKRMAELGFDYFSIGRPHYAPEAAFRNNVLPIKKVA